MASNKPKPLPTVCGHQDAKGTIIQYSASDMKPHMICRRCHKKGLYYAQPVVGVDLLLEGGYSVTIEV